MAHDSLAQHAVVRLGLEGAQTLLLASPLSSSSLRIIHITVDTPIITVTSDCWTRPDSLY